MTLSEILRKYGWIAVPILIAIGSFLGGVQYGYHKAVSGIEMQTDTVIKVVTVYKDFPEPQKTVLNGYVSVPKYKFLTDTLFAVDTAFLHDTTVVYLPREHQYYEEDEGRLRIWVSGYEPRLDRYELDRVETIVTKTVTVNPSRWGISVHAGYGAALYDKKVILAPQIGIGITYTILRL